MKNNYEETDLNKLSQENKELFNSANDFYSQDELDKKYNFYLSNLTNERPNTKINFYPKRSEQIERLLEEEKNIEDENVQRLKELRTKYLSSVKTFDEEKFNFFSKNASYDTDENKLWKINYSKKDLLNNNNSRNSLENNNQNQIQNQNNTNNSNNEINIDINKIKMNNSLNAINAINNNLGLNMAIYERKNGQNINQSYNTYKINDSDMNKTEEYNKAIKYDNLTPNQILENNIINNANLENDYNKLKYDYKLLQKDFINLMDKYNIEKNKNNNINNNNIEPEPNKENKNDETYNNYIEKELDELKKINSNYEFILSPLINYINDVDYFLDKTNLKKIDLLKIKKNIKILFPNKSITNNTKDHPLYPIIKLLDNYKNIIYKNDKIKNIFSNKSTNKNPKKKLSTYESILKSYNIKNNINNIKFKCMNTAKNKFSRSIGTTPSNNKNIKTHRIFPDRKNFKFLKSDKFRNSSTNRINNTTKNRSAINTSILKESK